MVTFVIIWFLCGFIALFIGLLSIAAIDKRWVATMSIQVRTAVVLVVSLLLICGCVSLLAIITILSIEFIGGHL